MNEILSYVLIMSVRMTEDAVLLHDALGLGTFRRCKGATVCDTVGGCTCLGRTREDTQPPSVRKRRQ
jgi:hypothetical protein